MAVVDKPWDGNAGRFNDEQYQKSCVLDRKGCGTQWASKPVKSRCSLPIKEPDGDMNKNAVHAAASRIDSVTDACPSAIAAAKAALRNAYKLIGDPVPDNLKENSATAPPKRSRSTAVTQEPAPEQTNNEQDQRGSLDNLADEFGVTPGEARHGETSVRGVGEGEWNFREDSPGDGFIGTLEGHFAVFNRWTEINSFFEGHFMESIAPGAFSKTFQDGRKNMRCLVQHGRDPQIGMKPLGPIREVGEDERGAYYEVPLLDTQYNRDLLPGLQNGLYGASFRFQVVREEVNSEPGRSDHNPDGIEERQITECKVREFGPVTFPAYEDATAGVRSLNGMFLDLDLELFARAHPAAYPARLAELLDHLRGQKTGRTQVSMHTSNGSGNGTRAATKGSDREAAPSTDAPGPEAPKDRLGPTRRLSAARKPIRSIRGDNEPWKL